IRWNCLKSSKEEQGKEGVSPPKLDGERTPDRTCWIGKNTLSSNVNSNDTEPPRDDAIPGVNHKGKHVCRCDRRKKPREHENRSWYPHACGTPIEEQGRNQSNHEL